MLIEQTCFEYPWTREELDGQLRQRNCIGMVCEIDRPQTVDITGYMVYNLHKGHIELVSLAVLPIYQRCGFGTALMEKLIGKLHDRRTRITLRVRDKNLGAHLWLKGLGFRAINVDFDYYDNGEDAYNFFYRREVPLVKGD